MAVSLQAIGEVILYVTIPLAVTAAAARFGWVRRVGPVLFCYGAGLVLGNQPFWSPVEEVALLVAQVAVVLAIPLLLFSLDLLAWLRLARGTLVSFAVCVAAVLVVTAGATAAFRGSVAGAPEVAGMMVGVYTGGTPNMAAIGTALGVDPEIFVLLNTADVLVGAVYLLFLLTVAGRALATILPPTPRTGASTAAPVAADEPAGSFARVPAVLLAVAVVAVAAGAGALIGTDAEEAIVILAITTLALGLSRWSRVRALPGSAAVGDGALLVFCVAIGATADFGRLVASSATFLAMVALVVFGSVLVHLAAARALKLDRDTVIITSTAAIFGPAFVPPVAAALGNREVVLSGLMTGLVGYAIGNYLGVGLAWVLAA